MHTPGTALLIGNVVVSTLRKCNWPEGAFSLLFGEGRTVGQSLVKNKYVKAVGFTGSRSGGRALFDLANAREEPIPVFAEMSSINPIFIMPGMKPEDMNIFVSGLAGSGHLRCRTILYKSGDRFSSFRRIWRAIKICLCRKDEECGCRA
jgi:NADP-dependent aldehyde dehydrogenase